MSVLNKEQQEFVNTINGPVQVIACPGSGKSTSLIYRVHHMLEQGIQPYNVLMITFTKAAAKEMEKKYEETFGKNPGIEFGTIHALCYGILRHFSGRKVRIISEMEKYNYFANQLRYHPKMKGEPESFIKEVILEISMFKNQQVNISKYYPECMSDRELFQELYLNYESYKDKVNKIDFDDMLLDAAEVLRNNPMALEYLQEQYQYIQVDEYQDTNAVQKEIIYKIASKYKNIAVVGDDDQSIYGFRGADPKIMLDFQKDFPKAKQIFFSTNYRSCNMIIEASDQLIQKNKKRFEKHFLGKQEGGTVKIIQCIRKQDEVKKIVSDIKAMIKEGKSVEECAILYRNNQQAQKFIDRFLDEKIPFVCRDGIMNKYDHWIFKDIQAYRRLSQGLGKETDVKRVLNRPNRYLKSSLFAGCKATKDSLFAAAMSVTNMEDWKRKKMLEKVDEFLWDLKQLEKKKPKEMLNYLFSVMHYKDYLVEYATKHNMEKEKVIEWYQDYIEEAEDTWEEWDEKIKAYNEELKEMKKGGKGVTLSTMHSAKGLEWETVYIIDATDDVYPSKKSNDIEEERRLFYVAMTRTKKSLYIMTYGKRENRSPFLEQIPIELLS